MLRHQFAIKSAFRLRMSLKLLGFLSAIFSTCILLQAEQRRPFTIKDSIEMAYLVNPTLWTVNHERSSMAITSPDQRWLLLITQRGILASNTIESTMWLFDRQAVLAFVSKTSALRPTPKALATFRAASDNPVISDVRWLEDSIRVAFLAKNASDFPHLYVANVRTSRVRCVTKGKQYVSAYNIRGDTIAYTTFDDRQPSLPQGDLVDVTGQSIWALLWRDRPLEEKDETWLLTVPNTLHVLRNGRELPISPTMDGRPLKLYFPILSLSPDGKSLVTIASVHSIPRDWAAYQPRFGYEQLRFGPENKAALDRTNAWKASVFVKVDLRTGVACPILNAPAGRSLFHILGPTEALWSPDSREILLSDTFLPLEKRNTRIDAPRAASPAIAIIDVRTHEVHPIMFLEQPAAGAPALQHVSDIEWDTRKGKVELSYASRDNVPIAFHATYRWNSGQWSKEDPTSSPHQGIDLTVVQDLNRAPVFAGRLSPDGEVAVVWDPNPQLASIRLGRASVYQWSDSAGNLHKGILVLPDDYKIGTRYPLVLQTHGYEPSKFFADGIYTTGSGGRALVGKEIAVLQVDESPHVFSPQEGPAQTDVFRSAIRRLTDDGLVDPKRVGVIGFSFTVFHTLYALTHAPDLFAAATITDGNDLSYWLYLTWTDIPFAQNGAEATNGGVKPFGKEGLQKWAESAPGFNLDQVRAPLLISCLEKGSLVATWDIYGGLRTQGKPVEMVWLRKENAPHVLVQPRHRYLSQQSAVDWFDFWLNGHEDPDSGKADQYARWRKLRRLKNDQQNAKESDPGN